MEINVYVTQKSNLLKNMLGQEFFHLPVHLAGESKSEFWTLLVAVIVV